MSWNQFRQEEKNWHVSSLANSSVCNWIKIQTRQKVTVQEVSRQKVITKEPFKLWPPYLVRFSTSMVSRSGVKVKVVGQRSRSQCKKTWLCAAFNLSVFDIWPRGQRSHGSRSKVTWVKVTLGSHTKAGRLTTTSSCSIIFFLLTSQKIPCRDLSTVEYKAHAPTWITINGLFFKLIVIIYCHGPPSVNYG